MRRRNFLTQSVGVGSAAAFAGVAMGQPADAPRYRGLANPMMAVGSGVFSQPRGGTEKVPGTLVCLTVEPPVEHLASWYVTLFAQFRGNPNEEWRYIPCRAAYFNEYQYQGNLRDIYLARSEGERVSLFIPDAAHQLPVNVPVSLRYLVIFWRTNNTQFEGLPAIKLPEETVTPRQSGTVVIFGRGDEGPPISVYKFFQGKEPEPALKGTP